MVYPFGALANAPYILREKGYQVLKEALSWQLQCSVSPSPFPFLWFVFFSFVVLQRKRNERSNNN